MKASWVSVVYFFSFGFINSYKRCVPIANFKINNSVMKEASMIILNSQGDDQIEGKMPN